VTGSTAGRRGPAHISASVLNADFARLGDEIGRASSAGVDSIHLDVMDGHFVANVSFGAPVVAALRPHTDLPFHTHLMVDNPLDQVGAFVAAGSNLVAFHVEAPGDPVAVIDAIHGAGVKAGLAVNPETPAEAVHPYLDRIDLLLVMTVHPGRGGQAFLTDVLPKLGTLGDEIRRQGLDVPIAVDGGVNLETIGAARHAGGDVLVVGSGLYATSGDLSPVVSRLRAAANASE
jgi:ribulose-phosphate 3-epimerase